MSQEMVPEESVQSPRRSGREIGYLAGRSLTGAGVLGLGGLSNYNYSKVAAYRLANDTIEGQQYLTDSSNFAIATAVAGAGYIAARIRENNDIRQGKIPARRSNLGRFSLKTLGVLTVGSASTSAGLIHAGLLSDFNNMGILFPAAIGSGAFTAGLGVATATNYIWNRSRNLQYVNHSAPNYSSDVSALPPQRATNEDQTSSSSEQETSEAPEIQTHPAGASVTSQKVSNFSESKRKRNNEQNIGWGTRLLVFFGKTKLKADNEIQLEKMQEIWNREAKQGNPMRGDGNVHTYERGVVFDLNPHDNLPPSIETPETMPSLDDIANKDKF